MAWSTCLTPRKPKPLIRLLSECQKAADSVLDRLYDCVTTMPVFVKIDDAVPLDSALLNRIVKAIREKKRVDFQYAAGQGAGAHPVTLEPTGSSISVASGI